MSKARPLRAKPATKRAIRSVVAPAPGALDSALRYHHQGQLPRAGKLYKKVLKREPDHVSANHLLGVLSHQTERNKLAIRLIAKAIAARPDMVEARSNLAMTCNELDRFDEVISACENAIAINPYSADAYYSQGDAHRGLANPAAALACF